MQAQKEIDSKVSLIDVKVPPMKLAKTGRMGRGNPDKGYPREIRERIARLVLLREKIHNNPTQSGFAKLVTERWGFPMSAARWNVYETGGNLTQPVENVLVRNTPGLTVDWLRTGERRGLSVDLDRRLYGTP